MSNDKRISLSEVPTKDKPLWWHSKGLIYTASGYGKKIPTSRMVQIGKRWHRVYCAIFSNIGTCYIIQKGERIIVND